MSSQDVQCDVAIVWSLHDEHLVEPDATATLFPEFANKLIPQSARLLLHLHLQQVTKSKIINQKHLSKLFFLASK